jgi:hypothetical protein
LKQQPPPRDQGVMRLLQIFVTFTNFVMPAPFETAFMLGAFQVVEAYGCGMRFELALVFLQGRPEGLHLRHGLRRLLLPLTHLISPKGEEYCERDAGPAKKSTTSYFFPATPDFATRRQSTSAPRRADSHTMCGASARKRIHPPATGRSSPRSIQKRLGFRGFRTLTNRPI